MAGLAALVVGGALLGTSMVASASSPTITLNPATVAKSGIIGIQISGSGFPANATGAAFICPIVKGEPTVTVGAFGMWPVGCGEFDVFSKGSGHLKFTVVSVVAGSVIATWPSTYIDSAKRAADIDAANFPVPPYKDEGGSVSVYVTFGSAATEASAPLTFDFQTPGGTTTTTSTTPCNAKSTTAKATKGKGTATVDPATCLLNDSLVKVTAAGITPNTLGSILECNSATGQPTVSFAGEAIPVSCSSVTAFLFTSTASGGTTANFTVHAGVVGPPTSGTDSAGHSGATDAANYPCPPTAAQASAGVTCVIAVGDDAKPVGDEIPVPISFNTGKLVIPPTTVPTTATTTKTGVTTATTSSSTSASSGSLAFTGTGPGVWWLGIIGIMLMILGGLMLLLAGPRLVFARAVHTSSRVIRRRS
jgi:hypothetical protein